MNFGEHFIQQQAHYVRTYCPKLRAKTDVEIWAELAGRSVGEYLSEHGEFAPTDFARHPIIGTVAKDAPALVPAPLDP